MVDTRVVAEEREEVAGEDEIKVEGERKLKDRKISWGKLKRVDSLQLEAGRVPRSHAHGSQVSWATTMSLAFQCIGIVYGDIGTSPLYVFASTFPNDIDNTEDVIGVLSLIIYTIALIPLIKYVFIVLFANDNGDGGTFALYSLICKNVKVNLVPNQQPEDRELSNLRLDLSSRPSKRSQMLKEKMENSRPIKLALFIITIAGTAMVIGDGILTPCISVLSAVSGIKNLGEAAVVWISIVILVILFAVQRFGTDKVGFTFAPIIMLWFAFIAGIGLYNLFTHDIKVLRAFNPLYIVEYFKRNGKKGWISLGGVFLCITGTEAMFADLGHFNVKAIQISFSSIVFPALATAYSGQAAYLMKFPDHVGQTFYDSIPGPLYWPTFVVAVSAAIIASQAMISGAFSIVSQSLSLGCFPRVKIVHTSAKYEGQVYIPEINYALMICCVIVCLAFRTTDKIGNAYGIAVVSVMVITTCLITLIMAVIWKTNLVWIVLFFVVFGAMEVTYLSSVLYKFVQGGFLPLVFSLFLMSIMMVWHYVHNQRYKFELKNKVSTEYLKELVNNPDVKRIPGVGLFYSELVQGIPSIFSHYVSNIPTIHSVLVFVSIKLLPTSKVLDNERFLFRKLEPRDQQMFRCVVRYGYKDVIQEPKEFEQNLVERLKEFIREEHIMRQGIPAPQKEEQAEDENLREEPLPARISTQSIQSFNASKSAGSRNGLAEMPVHTEAEEEMQFVQKAHDHGVVYLIGEAEVVAEPKSSFFKKIVVNYAYSFLRKNFRQAEKTIAIPHERLLRVGMTYEI